MAPPTDGRNLKKEAKRARKFKNWQFSKALKALDKDFRVFQLAPSKQTTETDHWSAAASCGTCITDYDRDDDAPILIEDPDERLAMKAREIFKALRENSGHGWEEAEEQTKN